MHRCFHHILSDLFTMHLSGVTKVHWRPKNCLFQMWAVELLIIKSDSSLLDVDCNIFEMLFKVEKIVFYRNGIVQGQYSTLKRRENGIFDTLLVS